MVLRALKILRFEDILKLSEMLSLKRPLKKAAGGENIVWDDAPSPPKEEAQVLSFARPERPAAEAEEQKPSAEEAPSGLTPSEFILLQRNLGKSSEEQLQKLEALKGYQKFTDMYVVKPEKTSGNEKIRFAATQGVLINKKQN
jgi:hypothetical protein